MGSVSEDGGGNANDGVRERQRFAGHKVYTRKAFKGPKKTGVSIAGSPRSTTTTTAATTNASRTDEKEINLTTTAAVATTATTDDHSRDSNGKDVNAHAPTTVSTTSNGSHEKPINITKTTPFSTTSAEIIARDANLATSSAPATTSFTTITDKEDLCLPTLVTNDAITTTASSVIENNNKDDDDRNNESNSSILTAATTYLGKDNTGSILPTDFTLSNGKKDDNGDTNPTQLQEPQTPNVEDRNMSQPFRPPKVLHGDATVLDDSSRPNRQVVVNMPGTGNGAVKQGLDDKVKINLMSTSKREVRELRRKLEDELDVVRSLVKKIEAKQGQLGFDRLDNAQALASNGVVDGLKRVNSGVMSAAVPLENASIISTPTSRQARPLNRLRVSVLENSQGMSEIVEKEKRTPKAYQFYRNSEFLLAKDKFPPAESSKKSKLNGKKQGAGESGAFGSGTKIFKQCSALLERLLKHRYAWVFKAPVDVEGLGLHDYYTIVTHPMDLGTVKIRLHKNSYKSSEEFAEDVRLTFHNAMRYNPKGHDVHIMAEELLEVFEEKWDVIKLEHDRETRLAAFYNTVPTPTPRKPPILPPPPLDMRKILDRSESMTYPVVDVKPRPFSTTPSGRTPLPKKPKPKAKDPHKRDMTYDEKQKLSTNLSSLPPEKLDSIVHIIEKRNSTLLQHGEEIEVDIDSVDTETLWELDRLVMNYKKSLSKNKRKAEIANQARAAAVQNAPEKVLAPAMVEATKETMTAGKNASSLSPVQVDKQGENGSRSSSSSGSSSDSGSSTSDSDSDSSSESGSDVDH